MIKGTLCAERVDLTYVLSTSTEWATSTITEYTSVPVTTLASALVTTEVSAIFVQPVGVEETTSYEDELGERRLLGPIGVVKD